MSGVGPADMQVTVTQSADLAKQYSQEAHKVVANQQTVAEDENKLQDENTKKVHDRNTAERIYVDEEENNKNKQENEKKKSNTDEDDEEELNEKKAPQEYMRGGHFDASI